MTAHIEEITRDPARHFARPAEVLERGDLTRGERGKILEQWRLDADEPASEGPWLASEVFTL